MKSEEIPRTEEKTETAGDLLPGRRESRTFDAFSPTPSENGAAVLYFFRKNGCAGNPNRRDLICFVPTDSI